VKKLQHRSARLATPLVVVLLVAGMLAAPSAVIGAQEDPAEAAARAILAARARANEAAAAYATAQFELEGLEAEASGLTARQQELSTEVAALRGQVEQSAVNRFMASGSEGIPLLTGSRQPLEQLQVDALVAVATETSADAFDTFDERTRELEEAAEAVAVNERERRAARSTFDRRRQDAEAEVVRLQAAEQQRLEDERVRRALEAQLAEERRQREVAAARAAEAQRIADAAARATAERETALRQAADEARDREAAVPAPAVAAPPAPSNEQPPTTTPRSAADEQPAPEAAAPPARVGSTILCPVNGTAYSDTWGAARSGGRSHQGVDMLGPRGTPILAVDEGTVQFKQNSLGGNAAWLATPDGTRYYYAHMAGFEGSSRAVSRGEVIGYLGDTGNARGTPHLHFEVHPGGGPAVPPYSYVRDAGC
jgi:peptidoglycan LD-endopeptidase LytH